MSNGAPGDDPLIGRVDALLRRHQEGASAGADDVPVLTEVGDGLRTMLFRDSLADAADPPGGPAFAVLGPDNEFEAVTPAALAHLERLAWGPTGTPVGLAPAAVAASRLRASGQDSVVLRARTRDGEWLVLRAGRYDEGHPPERVALTVERAQPPEIVSLMAAAHGLTVATANERHFRDTGVAWVNPWVPNQ